MLSQSLNPTIIPSTEPLKVGDKFAVYGTLRVGQGNYYGCKVHEKAVHLGTEEVLGTLYTLGGCPGLTQEPSDTPVVVDVFEVVEEDLGGHLDSLEGYSMQNPENSFYIRAPINLIGTGEQVAIYYYNTDAMHPVRLIKSGDWLAE